MRGEAGGVAEATGAKRARKHETHESSDAFPRVEVTRRDDSAEASDFPPRTPPPRRDAGARWAGAPRALAERRRRRAFLRGPAVAASARSPGRAEGVPGRALPPVRRTRGVPERAPVPKHEGPAVHRLGASAHVRGDGRRRDARVVAMLTEVIDHAASVFAETLLEHRDAVAGWATPAKAEPKKKRENISYSRRGFELAVDVDLHIARACGADGLLLGTSDSRFEAKARCCAAAAAEKGSRRGPGAPAGAPTRASPRTSARGWTSAASWASRRRAPARGWTTCGACTSASRRRTSWWSPPTRRERARLPTLAVAVVGWRLLGLPLVDPVSVSIDLQRARARAAAAAAAAARVGEEGGHRPSRPTRAATLAAGGRRRRRRGDAGAREAYEDALLAVYGGVEDEARLRYGRRSFRAGGAESVAARERESENARSFRSAERR